MQAIRPRASTETRARRTAFVFIYDYHPLAETLASRHLTAGNPTPVPEGTMWSYILQITSALKTMHIGGKACRSLDVSKVLVTGPNRYRRPASRERQQPRTAPLSPQARACHLPRWRNPAAFASTVPASPT